MLFKTLGILDMLAFLSLLLAAVIPKSILAYAGIYLALKGLTFILISKDLASGIDVAAGIHMLLAAAGLNILALNTAFLIYLGQKSALTLIRISIDTYSLIRIVREQKKASPDYYSIR
ncbi:hypothetical protein HYU11_01585 [Candidatus Woesearchaeota archaeon]|nr:hypothetical protein [Candidatus Woesearchaeota archaeon]